MRQEITIRAFKATDDPIGCAEFVRNHRAILESFGITNVTTNNETWCTDTDTYVIVAESPTHGMVGGIRVEVSRGGRTLPIEEALFDLDHRIKPTISEYAKGGIGEVCGLWNSESFNSMGLPLLLSFAAVSISNQLGIKSLTCLVAHYTLRHALKVGFSLMEEVGDGGTFTYPIPSIKAIAMLIPDAVLLENAAPANRHKLFSLRIRPEQLREEHTGSIPLLVQYDLLIDRRVIPIQSYQAIQREWLKHSA